MNRLVITICFHLSFILFSTAQSAEPDESGIGGTGASKPQLSDEIFSRPDIPEIIDIPEAPELSVPDIDDMVDGADAGLEFSRDEVVTPADSAD